MRRFFAAVAVGSILALGGCEDRITQANYESIKPGMALHDVEKLMGGKGEIETNEGMSISGAGVASGSGSSQKVFVWKKNGKQVSVTLDNGKVVSTGKAGF